jgi:Predicted amidohydrolase
MKFSRSQFSFYIASSLLSSKARHISALSIHRPLFTKHTSSFGTFTTKGLLQPRHQYLGRNIIMSSSLSSSSSPPSSLSSSSSLPINECTPNTRVALLQFKVTDNKEQNQATALKYLQQAHEQGASLAVLPEIWNSPYATTAFAEYAETLPDLYYQYSPECTLLDNSPSAKMLFQAAIKYKMYIIGGSIPEVQNSSDIYNTCLCISPSGKLIGKHRKVHLFDIDVPGGIRFMESDTLSPGDTLTAFSAGASFGTIGVGICYDIRFPEYALLLNQKYQCHILVYPGAFNMTTGPAHWELLQRARAVDNQCFVLTASPARTPEAVEEQDGNQKSKKYKHYTAWGHSTVVNPWGEVVGTCGEEESLVVVDLDMERVAKMREGIPTMKQKRNDLYNLLDVKERT